MTAKDSEGQPEESVELSYESISWEHCTAGTSAYSLWEDRVFRLLRRNIMNKFANKNPGWADYMGDMLRGKVPVNQLIPRHPYVLNTLQLEKALNENTQHIMLLTIDEGYAVAKFLYDNGTTYAGNIRDSVSGANNITKLYSYRDAGKLVFTLKGRGIKAIPYTHNGVMYIKITGYPSIRRILNGTRYAINNPKILELGIGKAGINAGILSGARFCIHFAAAQRVVEFIFSSEYEVAAFIGNLTMDVAKVIVTIFTTKIIVTIATQIASTLAFSATLPVSVGIVLIVVLGIAITKGLVLLDKKFHLSEHLIKSIKEGMDAQQKIMEWNHRHHYSGLLR